MKRASCSLLLAVVASAVLLPVLASRDDPALAARAGIQISTGVTSANSADPTTAAQTSAQTTTAAASSSSSSAAAAASSVSSSSATPLSATSAAATHATSAAAASSQTVVSSAVPTSATNSDGQVVATTIATVVTATPSASQTSTSNDSSSSSLSTGSIVGLSVAGGISALGIILFFVWKCTRKRFADFDDNEAIKWPELNSHNNGVHALPTNSTGRAGFGPENDSDLNLTRAPSPGGAYAGSIGASSVPEAYGAGDPYAVPPLPHLNPSQPYHDDPNAYGQPAAYYDPYRGPMPNTFTDTVSNGHDAESIPMTQMARGRSPAPQVAYDMQGRGSPAPQAAMGYGGMEERSRTPIPGALNTGRASPSPGYGYGPR